MHDDTAQGRLVTVFGWSPGVRTMLSGSVWTCGCSVGAYEKWDGSVVRVVERSSETCREPRHAPGRILGAEPAGVRPV